MKIKKTYILKFDTWYTLKEHLSWKLDKEALDTILYFVNLASSFKTYMQQVCTKWQFIGLSLGMPAFNVFLKSVTYVI